MKPLRLILIAAGGIAIGLACLATIVLRGRADYSDGPTAVANVGKLRKGMSVFQAIGTLHPARTRTAPNLGYSVKPSGPGESEMIHGLTPDRYLVVRTVIRKKRATSTGGRSFTYDEPVVGSWELRPGRAPREDVQMGRFVDVAGMRLNY